MKTFLDVLDYIQKAKRDQYGYHNLSSNTAIRIHNGLKKFDLCVKNKDNSWKTLAGFGYEGDIMRMHNVNEDGGVVRNHAFIFRNDSPLTIYYPVHYGREVRSIMNRFFNTEPSVLPE